MKIYLKNNILQDTEISEKAKLVYIALRSLMDNEAIQLFEIEDMLKIVRGKKERKQRAISKIQEGINRLRGMLQSHFALHSERVLYKLNMVTLMKK